jgi:hypothetical protein
MPRSGSAWLANFLTWGNCFSFHDPIVRCRSVVELDTLLDSRPEPIVGCIDTGSGFFPKSMRSILRPLDQVGALIRDSDAVRRSMDKLGVDWDWDQAKAQVMEASRGTLDRPSLLIEYETMFNTDALAKLCDTLGATFDPQRTELLLKTRVTMDTSAIQRQLTLENVRSLAIKESVIG